MAITPRLDNLAAMQNRPMGTNTALYRDPSALAVGRQYKQQKSDYDMARRLLRRQARRGDSQSALGLVGLGKDAAANDVEFGMQNVEQRDAAIAGRTAGMNQETVDLQNAGKMNRGVAAGLAGGRAPTNEPPAMLRRPEEPASVWNTKPTTALGTRAYEELGRVGDEGGKGLKFRQGLDRAVGMAKTDAERDELGLVAKEAGIPDEAFKRRTDWWNKKRKA